jgi:hypothetical protein
MLAARITLPHFTIIRPENPRTLASGPLPPVLTLEIPLRGRPKIAADLRALIRRMSVDNPLWGACGRVTK